MSSMKCQNNLFFLCKTAIVFCLNVRYSEFNLVCQACIQRMGAGKVQEFETISYPTLRSYENVGTFFNLLETCILLAPC